MQERVRSSFLREGPFIGDLANSERGTPAEELLTHPKYTLGRVGASAALVPVLSAQEGAWEAAGKGAPTPQNVVK